jgi:predicted HD superfamily hydrolase involved in NAD metabolism
MTNEPPGRLVRDAARGRLPEWVVLSERRRGHVRRVAGLLGAWADRLALDADEAVRWRAAGWLHDVLREAPPEALRPLVPAPFAELPPKLLHGPAAAERLAGDADAELLDAIRFHTLGSPRFGRLGRALYLADFLEPGRSLRPDWTARLRERMPHDLDAVLAEVVRERVRHVRERGGDLHPETIAFHGQVAGA